MNSQTYRDKPKGPQCSNKNPIAWFSIGAQRAFFVSSRELEEKIRQETADDTIL